MTHAPIPVADPEAALLTSRFASKGLAGLPGPFRAYASIQVWARAAERAGTFEPSAVAETLRKSKFDTVLGPIGFDTKGDVTGANTFVWYTWKSGEFAPLEKARAND
jgi:branched-chain amino acid transport system substrate-binding protein